jgi:ABC-type antimicrobial peptide transport system permease subunit
MDLHTPAANELRPEFQEGANMTSLVKSVILAVVVGILTFFGTTFLFLLLSLTITYYDVTMARLVKSTCQTNGTATVAGSCFYPPASTIIAIGFIVAIIVAVSIFVTIRRHQGKRPAHHFMEELKHEMDEVKGEVEQKKQA